MSIRFRLLFAYGSVSLLGFLVLILAAAFMLRDMSHKSAEDSLRRTTDTLVLEARRTVAGAQLAAGATAAAIEGLHQAGVTDRNAYAAVMRQQIVNNKQLAGGGLILEPNVAGADADNVGAIYANPTGRFAPNFYRDGDDVSWFPLVFGGDGGSGEWYDKPKDLRHDTISVPYTYPVDGVDMLWATASSPILDKSGAAIGVVTINFSFDGLQKIFTGHEISRVGAIALLNENGTWLSHSDKQLAGKQADATTLAHMQSMSGDTAYFSQDGVTTAIQAFELGSTAQKWFVVTAVADAAFLVDVKNIIRISLMVAAVFLVIGVIVIWMFGSTIAKSLKELAVRTRQMADGDMNSLTPCLGRIDEFGQLAGALEKLRKKYEVP